MIECNKLTKDYGSARIVSELSFAIGEGEIVGLLGPNGAGKTTTIRMLTTFLRPTSGTATVLGFSLQDEAEEIRRNLGYLPEHPPLYPELRVEEYLSFIGGLRGLSRAKLSERISGVLEECLLGDVRKKVCGHLSKGYQQRVGLAAALIHSPRLLILDEPTSGLDPKQLLHIRELIRSLRSGRTILLSTHILPEVIEVCDRVVILAGGKVVESGSIEELTREKTLEHRFLEAISRDVSDHDVSAN